MGWFDVHAHLTHERFDAQLEATLERARTCGLTSIITNGLNPSDNDAVSALAGEHPLVRPAYGFYPVDAVLADMLAAGEEYPATRPPCTAEEGVRSVREHVEDAFAVGEIGLDGYWVKERHWGKQEDVFRELVELAMQAQKPIIIHTRKRERRTLEVLDELGAQRVNWHCFGGRVSLAREIASRGHFLSIPANARRSQSFTRILETVDRRQLLLETDCPYLGPTPGSINEPANVLVTAEYIAELWHMTLSDVEAQLCENYERLFGSPP